MNESLILERDHLFDDHGLKRIKSYMLPDETSPQERFHYVSKLFASNDDCLGKRLYEYMSKHWLSPSTPQLSMGKTKEGLPIACFLPYISDTLSGLIEGYAEVCHLSVVGGGVGLKLDIRQAGEKSSGVLTHLKTYDASCVAFKQGQTRRGSYAAYLDIQHPEILQFIAAKRSTGDEQMRLNNIHTAINIPHSFMEKLRSMQNGSDEIGSDDWDLIDPHTKQVVKTVSVVDLWKKILATRLETGEPFIHFIDSSNDALEPHLKDLNLKIKQSNLCTEIILPTDETRTAVCCLASLNLEHYDMFKDNQEFFDDVLTYLDNVVQYFLDNASENFKRSKHSASQSRAVGVGTMGFHSYLQKNSVAFESGDALRLNNNIFKNIRTKLNVANLKLGRERGVPSDCVGTGKRHSHVMAIAPNATSSIIMGNTSPSIEPFRSVIFKQETLSGFNIFKNRNFISLLESKGFNKQEIDSVFEDVLEKNGSVQHLDSSILTSHEKEVFKSAMEIDQMASIRLAAQRQKFIDQSQSVNLFFSPTVNVDYLHVVHFNAWLLGLKTLYYCRSERMIKASFFNQCTLCEG